MRQVRQVRQASNFSECGNNGISDTQFIVGARNDPEKNPVGHWPWIASIGIYDDKKRLLRLEAMCILYRSMFMFRLHRYLCGGTLVPWHDDKKRLLR